MKNLRTRTASSKNEKGRKGVEESGEKGRVAALFSSSSSESSKKKKNDTRRKVLSSTDHGLQV